MTPAAILSLVDSFLKPGGRSSSRLIAVGSASCAAVYIMADMLLRVAVTVQVVMVYRQPMPAGVGMNENVLLACVGALVTLGGGTYWLNKRETTKRGALPAADGGTDGPG
jgi:hypothetical protein